MSAGRGFLFVRRCSVLNEVEVFEENLEYAQKALDGMAVVLRSAAHPDAAKLKKAVAPLKPQVVFS